MKNNRLVCLLVPTLALALPADIQGWADGDNGNGIVVGVGETRTSLVVFRLWLSRLGR